MKLSREDCLIRALYRHQPGVAFCEWAWKYADSVMGDGWLEGLPPKGESQAPWKVRAILAVSRRAYDAGEWWVMHTPWIRPKKNAR